MTASLHTLKKNDEVCTPAFVWRLAARTLGFEAFDLDPAGCEGQDETATRVVHPPDDGLAVEWAGRVWLNPPYSQLQRPKKWPWLRKAAQSSLCVALVPARTPAAWWIEDVLGAAHRTTCFRSRVQHKNAAHGATFAQCLALYGTEVTEQQLARWDLVIGAYGWTVRRGRDVLVGEMPVTAMHRDPLLQ